MNLHVILIELAWEYAKDNCRARKKHVSFILQNNHIICKACNGFEVPSRYAFMGYRSLHSEVNAIMKLNVPKENLHLYNFRFNNTGQLKMSCPCSICMPWCESVFDSITYSTNEGRLVTMENVYAR